MAVEFRDNGYSIHVDTISNPIEDWLELHNDLLMCISVMDGNVPTGASMLILKLIEDMMPDWETALKMHPRK